MGWLTQDNNDDAKVQVSADYSRSEVRTDFLVIDKSTGEHSHISISPEPGSDVVVHHDYRK